jgi:hypothetical protein
MALYAWTVRSCSNTSWNMNIVVIGGYHCLFCTTASQRNIPPRTRGLILAMFRPSTDWPSCQITEDRAQTRQSVAWLLQRPTVQTEWLKPVEQRNNINETWETERMRQHVVKAMLRHLLVTLFKQKKFTYRPTKRRENNLEIKCRLKEGAPVGAIANRGPLRDVNLRVIPLFTSSSYYYSYSSSLGPVESRLAHCSLTRLIVQTPLLVPPCISRGAPRQTAWETSTN